MAYRIEGQDIVVSGFDQGIADNPYEGISDMRCVNNTSIPGEVSVAFATSQSSSASASGSVASADASSDVVTYSSVVGSLFNGRAVTFAGGSLPAGIVAGTVYYMGAVSGSTSKLYTKPDLDVGNLLNITGTGTGTFASVNMGKVTYFVTETLNFTQTNTPNSNNYYCVDSNGRVWYYNTNISANSLTQNVWLFLNNNLSGGIGQGIAVWNGYLLNFRSNAIDYIKTYTTTTFSLLSNSWTVNWTPDGANSLNTSSSSNTYSHQTLVGIDGILYYCDGFYLGSFKLVSPQTSFDPATSTTYVWSRQALTLPQNETAQSLAELGTNLLIGCASNNIYQWDKFSTSFILGQTIRLPEPNVVRMVTANSNTYIFVGNRGNIYYTNGAQAQVFKKVPDHLSNTVEPYFTWGGAAFARKTLYFGVSATDNAGTAINQYGGLWAVDLDTQALRLLNQLSYATYAQIASAITPVLTTAPSGYGLWVGWGTGADSASTGGVDAYGTTPYTGGQSYVDSDMMPLGTYLNTYTPSQIEWKTSVALGGGGTAETIALYYRTKLTDSYTLIGTTTATGTSVVGTTTGTTTGNYAVSDYYQANFQKAQWVQLRAVLTSNATTPTYCRLTEIRIRNWPNK